MKRPPRVVIVAPHLDRTGGYEHQALGLAEALAQRGVSAWLLTEAITGRPPREPHAAGWIYRLPPLRERRTFLPPWKWLQGGWESAVDLFLREHAARYDAVHAAVFCKSCASAVRRARQLGKPSLVKVATDGDPTQLASGDRRARHAWRDLLHANHLLCISQSIADEFRTLRVPEPQLRRIPNGVDANRFRPPQSAERAAARLSLEIATDTLAFAFVGRLVLRKGVDVLLRAWATATERRADLVLLIAGDGPERGPLQQLALTLGVKHSVRFLGERADIAELLQACDGFLFPSRREGLSNALLQAMSTGLPVAATRIGGNVDLLEPPYGLLCPPGDVQALAAGIERMAADADFRREAGAFNRQRVLDRYAFPRIVDELLPLYEIETHKAA